MGSTENKLRPAAKVGSKTKHGTPLGPGRGSPNVSINGKPAWRAEIDYHMCPYSDGSTAHVGGVVKKGSEKVFINNKAAVREGDSVLEGGTPKENCITSGDEPVFVFFG